MTPPVVRAEHLRKTYDGVTDVLRDVNLQAAPGETVVIVGENGSGKTTLLNLLGGVDMPTAGRIELNGRDLGLLSEAQVAQLRLQEIGFVYQTHRLIDDLTVQQNVELPAVLARRRSSERAKQLLRAMGLSELSMRRPAELSLGQSQKVAIARALVNEPSLVLADEPAAALDGGARLALQATLLQAVRERGVTLVVSAVIPSDWAAVGRILRLAEGALAADTRTAQ